MEINKNKFKFNIYEVNALLFQIISYMSEADRQKLQALLTAKLPRARNSKDLSSLITSISESKRCKLLIKLSNWYHSKYSNPRGHSNHLELRAYPRKSCVIPIELSNNGFTFMCLTQNISTSGVFVQTDFSFHVDQKISMIFSPPKMGKDITVGGRIVRVESSGIGVKFNELLRDL